MKVEIRHRGVNVGEKQKSLIKRRLARVFGRFARHVGQTWVYLRDVNGPRGGPDLECRVVVDLPPRARAVVASLDRDIGAAVSLAAHRLRGALRRHVQRRRARHLRRRPALVAP
jgi:ribosome-associated translation inhibitor RaiA